MAQSAMASIWPLQQGLDASVLHHQSCTFKLTFIRTVGFWQVLLLIILQMKFNIIITFLVSFSGRDNRAPFCRMSHN